MTAMTVTATPTGATGCAMRVYVLTNALESGGNTKTQSGRNSISFTPTSSKSLILWGMDDFFSSTSMSALTSNLLADNLSITGGLRIGIGKYTGTVTGGTGVTLGVTDAEGGASAYLSAVQEMQSANGTSAPSIDASSPGSVNHTSGSAALTSASFTPPAGAVLVAACIGAGTGTTAWTITDSIGLTWTKRADNTGQRYYTATVPTSDTGTAAISMHKQALSAAGKETESGTGSVNRHKMGIAASGLMIVECTNSFEGGTNGTAISAVNSGGSSGTAWDALGGSSTLPVYSTSAAFGGTLGANTPLSSNSTTTLEWKDSFVGGFNSLSVPWYSRDYFKIATLPPAQVFFIKAQDDVVPQDVWAVFIDTSGHLGLRNRIAGSNLATATTAITTGSRNRYETKCVYDGATFSLTLRCFYGANADGTTPDETLTGSISSVDAVDVAAFGAQAATIQTWASVYHDNIVLTNRGWPGPASYPDVGTGSVHMHKQGLSVSGKETEAGTGSVDRHKMGLAASGSASPVGTVAVHMHKMGLSVAGKEIEAGTGSVHMHKQGLSSAGKEIEAGTGSVHMHKQGLSVSGKETETGTGSVHMHKQGLAVSGKETETGTGSVNRHKMGLAGYNAGVVIGAGATARHKMGLAAYGDPASIRLDNNGSGGTNGTAVSTANSGGASGSPFDTVSVAAPATATYDNTVSVHGLGFKYATGSPVSNALFGWSAGIGTQPRVFVRKYFNFPANPSGNLRFLRAMNGSTFRAGVILNSSGKIVVFDQSATNVGFTTVALPLNQRVRIEALFVGDSSAGAVTVKVFRTDPEGLVPDDTLVVTGINTGGTINRVDWGNPSSITSYTFYGEAPAASTRGWIGPVPMAQVARHKMGVAASGSMAGPDLYNDFSGLSNGTTLTTGNTGGVSGRAFDSAGVPAGGTLAADNTHLGLDVMALKVATGTTTGTPFVQWSKAGSLGYDRTVMYFRCDQLITTAATPAFRPFALRTTAGTHIFSPLISGNAISCSYGSAFNGLSAFTGSIANNVYFRLEGKVDVTAGTVHIELYTNQHDAVPSQVKDFTGVALGNNIQRIDIGNANSGANDGPFWLDMVAFSETGRVNPPSVAMHKMGVAASGKETESGTGSVHMHKQGVAVTGHVAYGAIRMHKMGLADAGTEKFIGTGSVHMHKPRLSSAGKETETGTGSAQMHKMGLGSAGKETEAGSGSVSMHKMGLSDAGTEKFIGTGSVDMHKMSIAEIGVETIFGVGNAQASKMGLSASGTFVLSFKGTGGVEMRKMQVLGLRVPIESDSLFIFSPV